MNPACKVDSDREEVLGVSRSTNNISKMDGTSRQLLGFGKAQRVRVSGDSENEALQLPTAQIPTTSHPARAPPSRQPGQVQAVAKPSRKPDVFTAPLPKPPMESIMDGLENALGSIEACSPAESRPVKRPTAVADLPLLSQAATEHLNSLDRQQLALQAWLNSTLCPLGNKGAETDDQSNTRLAAKMRGRLWSIYKSDGQLRGAMLHIEERLDSGSLQPSPNGAERALKGVKERGSLLSALGSYHPLWLRIAIEIAVGRCSNGAPLETFLKKDFLADTALLAQHQGTRSQAYWKQLGNVVLKRVLLVIALLDRAVGSAPSDAPLLFRRGATQGSSAGILQAAAGPLLDESDVCRRLGRLGYKVSYAQHPREEIEWTVTNLAVDLRDGLRLCRLAEVSGQTGVLAAARFPATRRPDRLYNVEAAIRALQSAGLSPQDCLAPAVVVDGDREATTRLLWRLVLQCQLPALVDSSQLGMEIDHLKSLAAERCVRDSTPRAAAALPSDTLLAAAGRSGANLTALLQWMQTVAQLYGADVGGFGSDLTDGSVFCLLVHHYLGPAALPRARIATQSPGSSLSEAIAGSRRNFDELRSALAPLGGVPPIINGEEFFHSEGADERAVALFAAFLCRRLIETNREHRAAMVIQRRWRERAMHQPGSARRHLYKWIAAAEVVQRGVRVWLMHRGLQQFAKDRCRFESAVTRLQTLWKARPYRRNFLRARAAAVTIQAAWRGKMARQAYFDATLAPRLLAAGLARYRYITKGTQEMREERAAAKIQAAWRAAVQRRKFLEMRDNAAATTLQAAWRSHTARHAFLTQRSAAIVVQRYARRWLESQRKAEAIERTKHHMAELAKTMAQFAARTAAAKRIQTAWKRYEVRRAVHALLKEQAEILRQKEERKAGALVIISHWVPTFRARMWFIQARRSAGMIQTAWRKTMIRRDGAATTIQKHVRAYQASCQLEAYKWASIKIQASYRAYAVRSGHPEAARLRAVRSRLRAAAAAAAAAPHTSLGARTLAALKAIKAANGRLPGTAPLQELARCTESCDSCCTLAMEHGAVPMLMHAACAAGRDKTATEALRWALLCVGNVCACRQHADAVFSASLADGSLASLVELLVQAREKEDVFMPAVSLLQWLVKEPSRGVELGRHGELMGRLEGVARLLCHKRNSAATYLAKLEGQKGSDASARQATKALVAVSSQLKALGSVLHATGVSDVDALLGSAGGGTMGVPVVRGKNTIVRSVLAELTNAK